MEYAKLTIAELANGISKTETAIRWCREILDDLHEPKTAGMRAVVKAIRGLLPKLEEDLKALGKAYANAQATLNLGLGMSPSPEIVVKPLKPYSKLMKPVTLPPGRDRLSTNPAPTASRRLQTRSARCG
jgi:hypothetical protein